MTDSQEQSGDLPTEDAVRKLKRARGALETVPALALKDGHDEKISEAWALISEILDDLPDEEAKRAQQQVADPLQPDGNTRSTIDIPEQIPEQVQRPIPRRRGPFGGDPDE